MIERLNGLSPISPQISTGGGYAPPSTSSEQNLTFPPARGRATESGSDAKSEAKELTKQEQKTTSPLERVAEQMKDEQENSLPLGKAIDRLNEKLTLLNRQVQVKLDERIGRNYISIVDKKTQEVIKEFPPEEIRNFMAQMKEYEGRLEAGGDPEKMGELIINLEV